jgi:long-chain fatty acid transport protein
MSKTATGFLGAALALTLILSLPATGWSSGFALLEQSSRGMGEAFAGGATETEQPNAIFYNPSGIAFLESDALTAGVSIINISTRFKDDGSATASGMPLSGGESGQNGVTGMVPSFYVVHGINEQLKIGLGVSSPFGLGTNYDSKWMGRYHAIKTALKTVDFSPAVAYRVNDILSLGGALNIQYLDAELTNAIDFGTILNAAAGTIPQSLDGNADLTGDDWGVGYSLGLLCQITPETKVGLAYRSKIDHTASGDVDFDVPAAARAIMNMGGMSDYFVDTHARADLTTPASLSLGAAQKLGERWEVKGDLTWTGWSCFHELKAKFNSDQPDSTVKEHWTDTMRYSLGLNYLLNEELTLRTGVCYDETPIRHNYRTPRIPGNNRTWLALGASYRINDSLTADLGYLHLFIRDSESDLTGSDNASAGYLRGEYENAIDVYSLQLACKF